MKTIQDVVSELKTSREKEAKLSEQELKRNKFEKELFALLKSNTDFTTGQNMDQVKRLLALIFDTTKKFKFPETQKVTGEVTVKNQVAIPEVKFPDFPDFPKNISVDNLPDLIPTLEEISAKLSKIELNPTIKIDSKAPKVSVDLSTLKEELSQILSTLKTINFAPEVNVDTSELKKATKEVENAIRGMKFPVPNVNTDHIASESTLNELWDTEQRLYAQKIETLGDYTFIGIADPGSLETDPVWRAKRFYTTGGVTKIEWSNGRTLFENRVDDFTGLTYS